MRPKCFCSFILATTVPLNIIRGWFGLGFLQENRTSVACLVGSGLNFADISGFFTMEKSMVSSAKKLDSGFYISFKIIDVNKE